MLPAIDMQTDCNPHHPQDEQPPKLDYSMNCCPMIPIRNIAGGASFAVRVQPRAKRNAIAGTLGDALKLALTSPPVEGRANEACIEFLARLLGVSRSSIAIAAGETSRNKVIRVSGLSAEAVGERLLAHEPSLR
jgi:uncharacterized protein (TIGR00251 family)